MASKKSRKSRLGKGLSSLMAQPVATDPTQAGPDQPGLAGEDQPADGPAAESPDTGSEPASADGNAAAGVQTPAGGAPASDNPKTAASLNEGGNEPAAGGSAASNNHTQPGQLAEAGASTGSARSADSGGPNDATSSPESGESHKSSIEKDLGGDRGSAGETKASDNPNSAGSTDQGGSVCAAGSAASTGAATSPASGADSTDDDADPDPDEPRGERRELRYLAVETIRPNPHQPRRQFDEAALKPLADSIKAEGLMQPIVVRPAPDAGQRQAGEAEAVSYELVAGERRLRAARLAELARVPALVRELNDQQLAEWALIENVQREDLNPIERAEAFNHLAEDFGLTTDQIGRRVGLDRASVANLMRLLNLCDPVRDFVRQSMLSMSQARAIAGLSDRELQYQIAERAIRQSLSVRKVEALVRQQLNPEKGQTGKKASPGSSNRSAYLEDLERQIAEQLQTRVHLRAGKKKGTGSLTLEFYSLDQFDDLIQKLGVSTS